MNKLKLICLGVYLFFVGLKLETVRSLVNLRLNRLVKKSGQVSDAVCVFLTNRLSRGICVWNNIEREYLGLYHIEKENKPRKA